MQKICVHHVTENMVETKMHGTVYIKTGFFIQWACVRHAI
jgi:hypothetical protein